MAANKTGYVKGACSLRVAFVAIVIIIIFFFAVVFLLLLLFIVGLFSKKDIGSRKLWVEVFWTHFAHAQWYAFVGNLIGTRQQGEAVSFRVGGVDGSRFRSWRCGLG